MCGADNIDCVEEGRDACVVLTMILTVEEGRDACVVLTDIDCVEGGRDACVVLTMILTVWRKAAMLVWC